MQPKAKMADAVIEALFSQERRTIFSARCVAFEPFLREQWTYSHEILLCPCAWT
jgi:hypothetical protein